ncbi:MAG: DUF2461 domain-containing protein [Nitrospinae bacterium]|nr:DUF2461 domain-containing protein [Nitrospinota bacterium]
MNKTVKRTKGAPHGGFQGFAREMSQFLSELSRNNNKPWFDKNKDRFRSCVERPASDFASAFCERLRSAFPDMERVAGKIFRIYRDTRFSKDKSPYKTHIGIRFGEDETKGCAAPFFYVQIEADRLWLVTGQKEFEKDALERFRSSVLDAARGGELEKITGRLEKAGLALQGEQYQNVPRGHDENHKRAELLKRKGLYVETDRSSPEDLYGPGFVDFCLRQFAAGKPLYDWLRSL